MHIHFNLQDVDQEQSDSDPLTTVQDWMLICQHKTEFPDSNIADRQVDWSHVAKAYSNLKDMPQFIAQPSQHHLPQPAVDSERLQGKQLEAYRLVKDHFESKATGKQPLRMIVSDTAGTGKSYLIQCLKLLLGSHLRVTAPTGVAAFNVNGSTLHSLLGLPVKGDFKELEGSRLHTVHESLAGTDYIIIDEMSMVGRKVFGQFNRRLRQVFPHR